MLILLVVLGFVALIVSIAMFISKLWRMAITVALFAVVCFIVTAGIESNVEVKIDVRTYQSNVLPEKDMVFSEVKEIIITTKKYPFYSMRSSTPTYEVKDIE